MDDRSLSGDGSGDQKWDQKRDVNDRGDEFRALGEMTSEAGGWEVA
jgi:hypothetical protein